MGGNINWDKKQNECLSDLGYNVYQVEFPKDHRKFIAWAKRFDFSKMSRPIYCIGRSSGGYLARLFSTLHSGTISKTVYICPVFRPFTRCRLKPKFKGKTMEFFGRTTPISTESFDEDKELLMLASRDENVPRDCFTDEQLDNALFLGPVSHTGMLGSTSGAFKKEIIGFLR